MKKQIFSILAVAAALVLSLSSCSKDDPASPLNVNTEQKGTIEGYIIMEESLKPNATTGATFWSSPKAVTIRATVKYFDLTGNANATGVYIVPQSDITYAPTTGKFSVNAPVAAKGCDVTITIGDVMGSQTQEHLTEPGKWIDVAGVYKSSVTNIVEPVAPGELKVHGSVVMTFTPTEQNGSEVIAVP